MIYLDNAATTFPKPEEVYKALDYANRNLAFNAGRGSYKEAKDCYNVISDFRKEIASFIKDDFRNVAVLSSATEALNIIINGLGIKEGDNVYISPFEHNAIVRPLYNLKNKINFNIFILPFDKKTWLPDKATIIDMFAMNKPNYLFLSQVSNVVGLKIDYISLFSLSKKYGCINILDSAQCYGILQIEKLNIDFIVFAGHKSMYGPFGVGGFINLNNYKLELSKTGGNGSDTLNHSMPENYHERYESGSPNTPVIYACLQGLKWIKTQNAELKEEILMDYLVSKLEKLNKVKLYLPTNKKEIFGVLSFSLDGYSPDDVSTILYNEYGICIRSGFHCSPFVHDFINSTNIGGTGRISLSVFNNFKQIDLLVDALLTF